MQSCIAILTNLCTSGWKESTDLGTVVVSTTCVVPQCHANLEFYAYKNVVEEVIVGVLFVFPIVKRRSLS